MCDYSQEVRCACKGVGGSVAKKCVLIYFTSPRLTPSLLGATGDAIRAVAREGPHLSKHGAQAQLGWRSCQSVYDSSCLIVPSCHNGVFPCHLFIQTCVKQHGLLPCLLRTLGISIQWCWLKQLASCFLGWVFPPRVVFCLGLEKGPRTRSREYPTSSHPAGSGRVGSTAIQRTRCSVVVVV